MLRLSVVVPTYRRPDDLARCLRALRAQRRAADEVLVVARPDDEATHAVLRAERAGWPALRAVPVREPGQVAALNAGLAAARGDVVAITDDDAAPRPDWLARIEAHFAADPRLGGVGGRDWIHRPDGRVDEGRKATVGRMQWVGRIVGNHHLGHGPAREVDVLKGANMSYRRAAVAPVGFDRRLRGCGAQVGNDLAVSLAVRRAGWKLVYDPAVAVDHYPAIRHDDDRRERPSVQAVANSAFNEALVVSEHLSPARRVVYAAYTLAMGTRQHPGPGRAALLALQRTPHVATRLRGAMTGKAAALRALHLPRTAAGLRRPTPPDHRITS